MFNFKTNFQLWVRRLMRFCALVSLFSVSLNTPKTFERNPILQYVTYGCDVVVTILFTAEMVAKMQIRGILKVRSRNRGRGAPPPTCTSLLAPRLLSGNNPVVRPPLLAARVPPN